ncbi:uncharacterized protein M421DRAFT_104602 [Didymella exigua CBS 183.55]|uniref:MFS general substrate transporter n=1 Tax=Didymella exigua CBS 183.55 TaxID=1150837 RepID=A0A6A5RBE4_9PLEO|nr:uncharacterized protein M421DRAFT_104602 [Didymella exigua CBS 183.55]KAF1923117.1 hypothetical protein M421DRAFT_104602 [Didymella exigua CBS 183.55]
MAHVQQEVEFDRDHQSNGTDSERHAIQEQDIVEEIEQVSLPPTGRGKESLLVLSGCSLIQIPVPVWGYHIAFVVCQKYYGSHLGIVHLILPFAFTILTRWPHLRRWFGPLGLVPTAVGFSMTPFATSVWQLIAAQDVMCALGCILLFTPTTLYLDDWFVKRKGLACSSATVRRISLNFIHLPAFWMQQIGNTIRSLGYFLSHTYLSTSDVQQFHVSTMMAITLLVLIDLTSMPGGTFIGELGDCLYLTFTSFSSQTSLLAILSITYGFFTGGFSSTWAGVLQELRAQSLALDMGFIFDLLVGGRAIGNVISGPLSVVLVTNNGWAKNSKAWEYCGQFGGVVLFTGVTALLGCWSALESVQWACSN